MLWGGRTTQTSVGSCICCPNRSRRNCHSAGRMMTGKATPPTKLPPSGTLYRSALAYSCSRDSP